MRVPWLRPMSVLAAAVLLVGACTGGGQAATSGPGGSGGTAASAATGSNGGGGDAGSLNACNLLTTDQIATIVGWPVKDGLLQNSDGQTDCEWDAQASDGGSVGLTILNFDDSLWQAGSGAGISTAVSGIGDAAYEGWPHPGDLNIKYKSYEVDVAIIDFAVSTDTLNAEDLSLAKLVLPGV